MKTTFGKHFLLCILGGSISLSGYAADGTTSIASGFDSTSGTYGTSSNTSILTVPVIGKYETDSWMFKLTVPYLQVTTLSGVIPGVGGGRMSSGGPKIKATTQSGLGDIVAAGTFFAIDGDEWSPGLDLTAKIKFPTADKNAGLGTGETDYALQMDVYQSIDKLTVTGSLGRKFLGSSATLPLNDIFYGSIGANYKVSDKTGAGINLDAAQASSATGYNVLELSVYVNHKIDKRRKVQGYLLKGLANGSPDTGLGMLFTLAL